ncbi:MAG: sce7726 family protein [Treponema sp.]|jgi:hypothetical protein|nr:sce7726 family protein [Treponema sp.]
MNDYEIREAICDYIERTHPEKYRIIDELVIGDARADIVVVTDELTGYEIKSDADSYTRLPGQIKEYDRYFQQNYLVVGANHKMTASKHVPSYWGVLCVSELKKGVQIETIRETGQNPKYSQKTQLSLLWRKELKNILKANNLPKCSGKTKAYMRKCILERVPKAVLQKQICVEFFERDWTLL